MSKCVSEFIEFGGTFKTNVSKAATFCYDIGLHEPFGGSVSAESSNFYLKVVMRKSRVVFLFCILLLTGIFSVRAQNVNAALVTSGDTKDDRYRIGFQDVLNIQVYRHADLDQKVSVSPTGTIELFRLDKPIVAVCKTEVELANELAAAYKAKYIRDPQVKVLAEQNSQSISVIGSVEKPGNYVIKRRYQLLEMLAQAGGPNKESGSRLIVARTGSSAGCREAAGRPEKDGDIEVMSFKIRDVQEGKKTMWMQPGDVISVMDSDVVYVYGNVSKQGILKIKGPTTLMQSLAASEGMLPAAKRDKVRILRQMPGNADRVELIFNLDLIDKGKIKDPFLEPDDIIAVSEDRVKSILFGVGKMVKTTLPSVIYRVP